MNMQAKKYDPFYQAQNILSRRDHSEHEVKTKMRRKGFTGSEINDAISELKNRNLLSDEKFTKMYVSEVLRFKTVGPNWIKAKLQQKGISTDLIESAISEVFHPGVEEKIAQEAANRWRQLHPQHAQDKVRLQRFLQSRGFNFSATQDILDTSS